MADEEAERPLKAGGSVTFSTGAARLRAVDERALVSIERYSRLGQHAGDQVGKKCASYRCDHKLLLS